MRYILHRTIHHLAGPFGEFISVLALVAIMAFSIAAAGLRPPLSATSLVVLLAAAALTLLHVTLSMRRMFGGNEAMIDRPCQGVDRSVPSYLEGAPTFVHYSHRTKVSLTRNIRSFVTDGDCEFTFYFLQPVMTEGMVVRPFGGTPRFDIVSCTEKRLHIRLARKTEVLKLGIFAQIMPVIQNHPDDPAPALAAFGR